MKVDTNKLPVESSAASYVVDIDNKNETVGLVDYLFVAKVLSNDKTIYKDVITMETENGSKEVGSPYTQYTIEVMDNIKGKLKKNKPFQILKDGGVDHNLEKVILDEGDMLPQENKYYIFLGFAQKDGSLLISGPNSNIPLDADNKQQIVSSKEYKEYKKAEKEQEPFKRDRSKCKFEE